jgi:hypothetical protein
MQLGLESKVSEVETVRLQGLNFCGCWVLAPAVPDAPVLQTTIQRALSRTSIYRDNTRYGRGRGELKARLGGKKSHVYPEASGLLIIWMETKEKL